MLKKDRNLIIATRGSALALWQANTVCHALQSLGFAAQPKVFTTTGDQILNQPLNHVHIPSESTPSNNGASPLSSTFDTGKGLFVKEIQQAVLDGQAHIAVHSMKDLPILNPSDLTLGAILPRGSVEDVLIFSPAVSLEFKKFLKTTDLFKDAEDIHPMLLAMQWHMLKDFLQTHWKNLGPFGTVSQRRQAQVHKHLCANITCQPLRGNINTRLQRVQNHEFSAIILAKAGLERLDVYDPQTMITLPADPFIPAPAQGAIGLECLKTNLATPWGQALQKLNHSPSASAVKRERQVLKDLGGDCHTPVAIHYFPEQNTIKVMFGKTLQDIKEWDILNPAAK